MNQKGNSNINYYIKNLYIGIDNTSQSDNDITSASSCIKHPFWPAVIQVMFKNKSANGQYLTGALTLISSVFFNTLMIICIILAIKSVCLGFSELCIIHNNFVLHDFQIAKILHGGLKVAFYFLVAFNLFLYGVFMKGSANDIEHEKDRNYVISVFSLVTSLSAFFISLLSLINDIG